MAERILLTRDNGVAEVRLNRPEKHNALDLQLFRAIADTQKALARDRDLRAVILSGSGVDFCSGLDIKSVMKDPARARRLLWKWLPWRSNLFQVVSTGWRRLPVPVIAAIHGRCWGGGFQIALGADFRIVHPNASLSIMESKWGLVPDMGGSLALRELTGRDQATWLAMSAEEFSGRRALELGLATAVTDDPGGVSRALAEQLLQRSPDAVAGIKRLFLRNWRGRAGTALARETLYQLRVMAGANQRIAVKRQFGEEADYRPRGRW